MEYNGEEAEVMTAEKEGKGILYIVITAISVITAAVAGAVLCFAVMLFTQSKDNPVPVGGGISVESLSGGENAFIDDSFTAHLLACAVSRAKETDSEEYTEQLMTLNFLGEGSSRKIVLARDDDGKLGFIYPDGSAGKYNSRFIQKILLDSELDRVLYRTEPDIITVAGQQVQPWHYSFSGTSLEGEEMVFEDTDQQKSEITITSRQKAVEISAADEALLNILDNDGNSVFSGTMLDYPLFQASSHNTYKFEITMNLPEGVEKYAFLINYKFEPLLSLSKTSVAQGDTIILKAQDLLAPISCSLSYGYEPFLSSDGDSAWCYIPISHERAAGSYSVSVTSGDYSAELPFEVTDAGFEVQHMTISEEVADNTANSAEANQEYVDRMWPLFYSYDPNVYWDGVFIKPVEGTITTEFGIYRYVNDNPEPTRHKGIDIAAAEGTPIVAPNSGVVLFSDFLQLSGNSILIEHGMGLHSLFMHMSQLAVSPGDYVEKGQVIGYVGSTGYSTGPHLHYQLMIGDQAISPWPAFDGTAGFYTEGTA